MLGDRTVSLEDFWDRPTAWMMSSSMQVLPLALWLWVQADD